MLRKDQIVRFSGLGNIAAVKDLLEQGVNPNTRGHFGMTSLMVAVKKRQYSIAQLLLMSGADPNLQADCGDTALMISVRNIDFDMVKILLDTKYSLYRTNVSIINKYGESAIDFFPNENELNLEQVKLTNNIKKYLTNVKRVADSNLKCNTLTKIT